MLVDKTGINGYVATGTMDLRCITQAEVAGLEVNNN